MNVVAMVLPRASLDAQRLPRRVVISARDVARGYVELPDSVRIDLRTNYPADIVLSFAANAEQVAAVEVGGARVAVRAAAGPRRVAADAPGEATAVARPGGARLGTIAFPVSISVAPA